MAVTNFLEREFSGKWAYDTSLQIKREGELWDIPVINQSIELILGTLIGERFFNPMFGSNLPLRIFENIDESTGEQIIEDVIGAIKRWEDRIYIIEEEVRLTVSPDEHFIIIDIPYILRRDGRKSRFEKKIFA